MAVWSPNEGVKPDNGNLPSDRTLKVTAAGFSCWGSRRGPSLVLYSRLQNTCLGRQVETLRTTENLRYLLLFLMHLVWCCQYSPRKSRSTNLGEQTQCIAIRRQSTKTMSPFTSHLAAAVAVTVTIANPCINLYSNKSTKLRIHLQIKRGVDMEQIEQVLVLKQRVMYEVSGVYFVSMLINHIQRCFMRVRTLLFYAVSTTWYTICWHQLQPGNTQARS